MPESLANFYGRKAIITHVDYDNDSLRLLEIGLVPETIIEFMGECFLGGTMMLKFRDTIVCVRRNECEKIYIQKLENPA